MRRFVATLLILCTAPTAWASSYVVRPPVQSSYQQESSSLVTGILAMSKSTYAPVGWGEFDTTAFRTLTYKGVRRDAIVVPNYFVESWTDAKYDPGRVTRVDRWPLGPLVLIGASGTANTVKWADGSSPGSDTTGIQSNAGPWVSTSSASYRQYDVATGRSWWAGKGTFPLVSGTKPTSSTVWRPIWGVGRSRYQLSSSYTPYSWYEELVAMVANPDTVALLVRYPPAKHIAPVTKAPIVIANQSGFGNSPDASAALLSLVIADSACAGKVFDNPAGLPIRSFIAITGAGGSGSYLDNTTGKTGVFCRADSCDSANFRRAVVDSLLPTLIATDSKITISFSPDSLGAYFGWQLSILKLLGDRASFQPVEYVGTSQGGTAALASKYLLADILGENRTGRSLLPPGASTLPASCGTDSANGAASTYCQLKRAYAVADSLFGAARVDHTLYAPARAWAKLVTRTNGISLDYLIWVFYMAGVRAIETDPLAVAAVSGAGPNMVGTSAAGYLPVYENGGVPANGATAQRVIYRMPIVPVRHYENGGSVAPVLSAGHEMFNEFLFGRFVAPWYIAPFALYQHDFQTNVFGVRFAINSIGGAGQGTTPFGPALRDILALLRATDAANRRSIPGKTIWKWDTAENVATKGVLQ